MNKELELFKKWFEIDLWDLDEVPIVEIEKKYFVEKQVIKIFFSSVKANDIKKLLKSKFFIKVVADRQWWDNSYNYISAAIFDIPTQYHTEYEDYVETKKDKNSEEEHDRSNDHERTGQFT